MNKKLIWGIVGIIAIAYVLNFGAGIIEIIPDNFPIIGNIDEGTAGILLLKAYQELFE